MLYSIPRNHTILTDRSKNSKYEYVTDSAEVQTEEISLIPFPYEDAYKEPHRLRHLPANSGNQCVAKSCLNGGFLRRRFAASRRHQSYALRARTRVRGVLPLGAPGVRLRGVK